MPALSDASFALIADDTQGAAATIHIIVWNDPDERWHWNVACCGESFDDYAFVSFENTDAGYPARMACPTCFDAFGSDAKRAREQ